MNDQPPPTPGQAAIYPLVLKDIEERVTLGCVRYGVMLMSHNGRNALVDAYQEAIDLVFYLRQAIEERGGKCQTTTTTDTPQQS